MDPIHAAFIQGLGDKYYYLKSYFLRLLQRPYVLNPYSYCSKPDTS